MERNTDLSAKQFTCGVCGSEDFNSEAGFYYCTICNTQSQLTVEFVEDVEQQVARSGATVNVATLSKKTPKAKLVGRVYISSWEIYNLMLKAMADKMVDLGFPTLLRDKVFQLWKAYLLKRNVFICENNFQKPSVSSCEPLLNFMTFYNWKRKQLSQVKRQKPEDEPIDVKRFSRLSRKPVFEATYNLHSQSLEGDERYVDNDPADAEQERPFELTPAAKIVYRSEKKSVKSIFTNDRRYKRFNTCSRALEPEIYTFKNVIITLFVACRQIGCRILFTDLIRLVYDGTLFVKSIEPLMDVEAASNLNLRVNSSLRLTLFQLNDPTSQAASIHNFLQFVGVKNFQYPRFQEFLPKFIEDSSLPKEFEVLLIQINNMFSEEDDIKDLVQEEHYWKILIEVMITSMITMLLRMLFGLDDVTECHQSRFATKVNEILLQHLNSSAQGSDPRAEWTELFDIQEWFRFIRYRKSFLEQEALTPFMFPHNKPPNLIKTNDLSVRHSALNNLTKKSTNTVTTVSEETEPSQESSKITLSEKYDAANRSLTTIFNKAAIDGNGGKITEVSDYVSLPYPSHSILEQYEQSKPNISYTNYVSPILNSNFGKKRVDFIFHPEKYIPLLNNAGYSVRLIPGTASQCKKLLKFKPRTLYLFQPYKKFDYPIYDPTSNPTPASMQFLFDYFSQYIFPTQKNADSAGESILREMTRKLSRLYSLRSYNAFIPLDHYHKA